MIATLANMEAKRLSGTGQPPKGYARPPTSEHSTAIHVEEPEAVIIRKPNDDDINEIVGCLKVRVWAWLVGAPQALQPSVLGRAAEALGVHPHPVPSHLHTRACALHAELDTCCMAHVWPPSPVSTTQWARHVCAAGRRRAPPARIHPAPAPYPAPALNAPCSLWLLLVHMAPAAQALHALGGRVRARAQAVQGAPEPLPARRHPRRARRAGRGRAGQPHRGRRDGGHGHAVAHAAGAAEGVPVRRGAARAQVRACTPLAPSPSCTCSTERALADMKDGGMSRGT